MAETQTAEAAVVTTDTVALKDVAPQYFRDFDFASLDPTIESLLKAGVHFGHLKSRRHPKMDPFIFTTRKNISIANLEKTLEQLSVAVEFLQSVRRSGKPILFVGIKKQTHDAVRSLAERLGEHYVIDRWLGGTLTNFNSIRGRAKYLVETQAQLERGEFKQYTKLERLKIGEELEKLEHKVGGIKRMLTMPGAIVLIDTKEAELVVREAAKMHVPLVGIVDTNTDPSPIDYPIPGNDDALSSIRLLLGAIGKALIDVQPLAKEAPAKGTPSVPASV